MIKTSKINYSKLSVHIALILGSIIMIIPFIWMFLTSFKTYGEAIAIPMKFLPENWILDNYIQVNNTINFFTLYCNTIIVMAARIALAIIFSTMAGFAFGVLRFKGREFLFSIVIIQMMIPTQVFTIPQYIMVGKLGLFDSISALIFPGLVSAFGTFLMRQNFLSMPHELEEAAIIDGCNPWQIYSKIMLPLVKNATVALGIFTALFSWKDLMWPLIVNSSANKLTISAGLSLLKGQYTTNYPAIMAGSVLATVPMIILYVIFQKHFVDGITFSGIK